MKAFWLCFVPLFVAVDAFGVLPIFMGLTEGIEKPRLHRIVYESVLTAMAVALLFLAVGTAVLELLGITVADFTGLGVEDLYIAEYCYLGAL